MDAFPAFYPLRDRKVVIAGNGEPADARARLFAGSPAVVVRIEGPVALGVSAYAGAHLAFVASHDNDFAKGAAAAARAAGVPVNVFDRPALSDFHTPAIVDRGAVVAAVGTAGAAPLLAQTLRADLEAHVPEGVGPLAAVLGKRRDAVTSAFPDLAQRRSFLRAVLASPVARTADADALDAMIAAGWAAVGRAWLIAMPHAADLISIRAQRALNSADIVIAPASSASLIATHARRDAERLTLGAAEIAERVRGGALVAVIDPSPRLAAELAALGVCAEVLNPAPPQP